MAPTQQASKRAILYARTSADSENEGLKLSILLRLDTSMSGIIRTTEDRSKSNWTPVKTSLNPTDTKLSGNILTGTVQAGLIRLAHLAVEAGKEGGL